MKKIQRALVVCLILALALALAGITACGGKEPPYSVEGAKDWHVKTGASRTDFGEGVTIKLRGGGTAKAAIDASAVKFDVPGSYEIVYFYGGDRSESVTKSVKVYGMPTFNVGEAYKLSWANAKAGGAAHGVTAADSFGAALEIDVLDDGGLKPETVEYKTYKVKFSAADRAGNAAVLESDVTIGTEECPEISDVTHKITGTSAAGDCRISADLKGGELTAIKRKVSDSWTVFDAANYDYDETAEEFVFAGAWLIEQQLEEAMTFKAVTTVGEKTFTLTLTEDTVFEAETTGLNGWVFKMGETAVLPIPAVEGYRAFEPVYTVLKGDETIAVADGSVVTPVAASDYDMTIRITMTDGIREITVQDLVAHVAVKFEGSFLDPMTNCQFEDRYQVKNVASFGYTDETVAGREGAYRVTPSAANPVFGIPAGLSVDRTKYSGVAFDVYSPQGRLVFKNELGGLIVSDAHEKWKVPADTWTTLGFDFGLYDDYNAANGGSLSFADWGLPLRLENWETGSFYLSNFRFLPVSKENTVTDFETGNEVFVNMPVISNNFFFNGNLQYVSEGRQSLGIETSAAAGVSSNQALQFAFQARRGDQWKQHMGVYIDLFIVGEPDQYMKFHEGGSKSSNAWWKNVKTNSDTVPAGSWQTVRLNVSEAKDSANDFFFLWCAGRDGDTNISSPTTVYADNIRFEIAGDESLSNSAEGVNGKLIADFGFSEYLTRMTGVQGFVGFSWLERLTDSKNVAATGVLKCEMIGENWDQFRFAFFDAIALTEVESVTVRLCVDYLADQFNLAFNGSEQWDGISASSAPSFASGVWKDYTLTADMLSKHGESLTSVDLMFGGKSPIYIDSISVKYTAQE